MTLASWIVRLRILYFKCLLQRRVYVEVLISHIPKDIIEEALNITISEADFRSLATAYADTNHIPAPQSVRGDTEPLSPSLSSTRGLDMIVSAVQQIESRSIRLPSITQSTQTDSS